jgi:hypothetical protein
MRAFLVGLMVLVACSSPAATTNSFSGTWQVEQPSAWTEFRFTLSQTACTNVLVNGPCDSAFAGNATSTPAVCQVHGMAAFRACGCEYTCGGVFPVTGKVAADSVTLNLLLFSDGSSIDFAGYMAANRTIIGDLWFSDPAGVVHSIGGGCDGYPACLDTPGGQLDFIRGGSTVVAGEVLGRNIGGAGAHPRQQGRIRPGLDKQLAEPRHPSRT